MLNTHKCRAKSSESCEELNVKSESCRAKSSESRSESCVGFISLTFLCISIYNYLFIVNIYIYLFSK